MKAISAILIALAATLAPGAGHAFPDGAPWGSANPANNEGCASCHFGDEPVMASPAIFLEKRVSASEADRIYELTIRFIEPGAAISGMQVITSSPGSNTGSFIAAEPDVEFIGSASRSTAPRRNGGSVEWTMSWRAPKDFREPVVVYVAVSASNDDGSPFGDTIHFRSFTLQAITREDN